MPLSQFFLWVALSLLGGQVEGLAQETATVSEQPEAQYAKAVAGYKAALSQKGLSQQEMLAIRAAHHKRLAFILDTAIGRPLESYDLPNLEVLSRIAADTGRHELSAQIAEAALTKSPNDQSFLGIAIYSYLKLRRFADAQAKLEHLKAGAKDSSADGIHVAFARAYDDVGQTDEAIKHYAQFLKYLARAVDENPGLAKGIPGILRRYRSLAGSDSAQLLVLQLQQELDARIRSAVNRTPAPDRGRVTNPTLHGLFLARLSVRKEGEFGDVGDILGTWADALELQLGEKPSPTLLKQQVEELARNTARYSCLIETPEQATRIDANIGAIRKKYATLPQFPDQELSEAQDIVKLRSKHLELRGSLVPDIALKAKLSGAKPNDSSSQLICLWSPTVPATAQILSHLKLIQERHTELDLALIGVYRGEDAKAKAEMKFPQGQQDEGKPLRVGLLSANDDFLRFVNAELMPCFVLVDQERKLRDVVVGYDELRREKIDTAIKEMVAVRENHSSR